jgi:hypothetical protein
MVVAATSQIAEAKRSEANQSPTTATSHSKPATEIRNPPRFTETSDRLRERLSSIHRALGADKRAHG